MHRTWRAGGHCCVSASGLEAWVTTRLYTRMAVPGTVQSNTRYVIFLQYKHTQLSLFLTSPKYLYVRTHSSFGVHILSKYSWLATKHWLARAFIAVQFRRKVVNLNKFCIFNCAPTFCDVPILTKISPTWPSSEARVTLGRKEQILNLLDVISVDLKYQI
jgi:hypothetical protein